MGPKTDGGPPLTTVRGRTEPPCSTADATEPPPAGRALTTDGALVAGTTTVAAAGALGAVLTSHLPLLPVVAIVAVTVVVAAFRFGPRMSPVFVAGLGWSTIAAATTAAVILAAEAGMEPLYRALLVACCPGPPAVLIWLHARRTAGTEPVAALRSAATTFTRPRTGLPAVLTGLGTALPTAGTYAPVLTESDSAWIAAATLDVRENGLGLIQETQDVFLPHLTLGPLLALDGYRAAIVVTILSVMALTALTAYLAYRLTGTGSAALVASLTLLSIPAIPERADRLPMYAATFFFAYGAAWMLHRAMSDPDRHRWLGIPAGIGFVLAYEAHSVGQIFLMTPFVLLLLHPWRRSRWALGVALATIAVVSVPRVIVNLSVDGLTAFRSNYTDFMVREGYLNLVNRDFWGHRNDTSALGYLRNLPEMTGDAFGGGRLLPLIVPLVILAAWHAGWRARTFALASTGLFLVALAVASPATFGRYLTPLAVGIAVVCGVGIKAAAGEGAASRQATRILVAGLAVGALFQLTDTVTTKADESDRVRQGPWPELATIVDDDRAVIGVRSHQLLWADPTVTTLFARTLSEDDFITYLTWPSDEEVTRMMDRLDVGWVYLIPHPEFEIDYHQTWMGPTYGLSIRHPEAIMSSDALCLAEEIQGHMLYRYGDCRPGDLEELRSEVADRFLSTDDDTGRATLD